MDQPHNRNALTPPLMAGLTQGLEAALADESVGVIVLTNSGPAFCAGADLSGASAAGPAGGKRRGGARGVGLAAACDLSVAGDDVKFGLTEVRVGVALAIISAVCLPNHPRSQADAPY